MSSMDKGNNISRFSPNPLADQILKPDQEALLIEPGNLRLVQCLDAKRKVIVQPLNFIIIPISLTRTVGVQHSVPNAYPIPRVDQ